MSQMTFSDYEYSLRKRKTKLEENHLGEVFFKAINRVIEATGHIMHGGTIVDATIIRDEMPHWCGFRKWFGAYNHSHSSQCTRYNRSTQITAGGRSCCIWGQWVYWN